MNEPYILIDSVYINSGGGEKILNYFIDYVKKKSDENKYFFLLDDRLKLENKKINFLKINASEQSRKFFYLSNKKKFKHIVCMSNVPPPVRIENALISIYFHNDLLLNPIKSHLAIITKFKNILKKNYIKFKNKQNYSWIVQTNLMKCKLEKHLKVDKEKIKVIPIIETQELQKVIKKKNTFVYVSNFSKHKNHFRLFQAFVDVCKEKPYDIELNLTIENELYKKSFYNTSKKPKNLKIINHGIISSSQVTELYNSSEFLIYPSLNESLGMPLVEAILSKCKVIASDLNYVDQVIIPSLKFDPSSTTSIAKSIKYAIENSLDTSKIIIENKIDTFVKHINCYV